MSKRLREPDLLLTCSNPTDLWNTTLVPDVQQTILSSVSPLEHLLFALTCKTTYAFCRPRLMKQGFHRLLMQYGTLHLCDAYGDEFDDKEEDWHVVAAGAGNVETLKWYCDKCPNGSVHAIRNAAFAHGGMEIIKFCIHTFPKSCLGKQEAEKYFNGNPEIEVIDYILKNCLVQCRLLLKCALKSGNSRIARYLMDRGETFSSESMKHAIHGKNLDCVKMLSKCNGNDFWMACEFCSPEILDYLWDCFARANETADTLSYISDRLISDYLSTMECMEKAISQSNLPNVKWLYEHGFPVPLRLYRCPVDIEVVQFLVNVGMPKYPSLVPNIKNWRNINVVKALHHMGFDLSQYGYENLNWDISVMDWLHEQGHPLTPRLFLFAIEETGSQHLEWLYQRGCPFDTRCMETAIIEQRLEIVTWLMEHGCPCHAMDFELALIRGYLDIADYLWNHGIRYNTDPTQSKLPYVRDIKTKAWIERHPIVVGQVFLGK